MLNHCNLQKYFKKNNNKGIDYSYYNFFSFQVHDIRELQYDTKM